MAFAPALLILVFVVGFSWWIYYRREFGVRSRGLLLAARLIAVAGLVLLLWNPDVSTASAADRPARFVILDASRSMSAAGEDGTALWESGVERARALSAGGARLLLAGASVLPADPDSLETVLPRGPESLLAPAVGIAAEAGARQITLITDRRIRDPLAAAGTADRLGVSLAVEDVGPAAPNLGIARLDLPSSVQADESVRGRIEVEGDGGGDSITVSLTVDGETSQVLRLPPPTGGGISSADFVLADELPSGAHRVIAQLEGVDAFSGDDRRVRIVEVDPDETGVLLVSFIPDWESRFLFPALEQVTGLPARGFVRTGPDMFQPMDRAGDASVDQATLARLMSRAEMVVAMGVDAATEGFVARATSRTPRLLLFPHDGVAAAMAGVAVGGALSGEWYLDVAPPSPIAGEVGTFRIGDLPPLTALLPVVDEAGGAALNVRLGGAGEPEAAVVLRSVAGRRTAVVLARGFWRWAFRDGVPRDQYRRLWAAVGGWMMADEPLAAGPGVRPAETVAAFGGASRWLGHGYEGEEFALVIADSSGAVVHDSAVVVPRGGAFSGPVLPPGPYTYSATSATDTTAGVFEVEDFTDEMLHRVVDAAALTVGTPGGVDGLRGSRPLRTWPLAYLVVLTALCGEWIGRRRAGLR